MLDFLGRIKKKNAAAYDRIQYIEQPTHRNLKAHPENRMHEAAKLKPIVIDESLVDYESLLLARELGYSGAALKACKGQTDSLLLAAAAQKFGMFLCVQDLTCPGASFLQSAALAARIPTAAAVEGNARQYCPAASKPWAKKYPDPLQSDRRHGRHRRAQQDRPGVLRGNRESGTGNRNEQRHAKRAFLSLSLWSLFPIPYSLPPHQRPRDCSDWTFEMHRRAKSIAA